MQKRTLFIGGLGVLILAVLSFGTWTYLQNRAPHIQTTPASISFGDIDQAGGPVSTEVEVKNIGTKPLTINRISTSCGCTTAKMDMNPLKPGASRMLMVQFDPMVHPDESGPITRVVYLQTSDEDRPELEIEVTGIVIPKK